MDLRKQTAGKLPLAAQADVAYLIGLATGKIEMPADEARKRLVLARLKKTVKCYLGAETTRN